MFGSGGIAQLFRERGEIAVQGAVKSHRAGGDSKKRVVDPTFLRYLDYRTGA